MATKTTAQFFAELRVEEGLDFLQELIRSKKHLAHLKAEKRGKSIALVSYPNSVRVPHARLTHFNEHTWELSFPRSSGRWERTPFVGTVEELTDTLLGELAFHLVQR